MYVSHWMTRKVFTISPEDSVSDAIKLLKEKNIKHLPVLKNDKLIGIISDQDIKEYSPSKATALDVYELHYLLAKEQVKNVMKGKVITTSPDTPIEEAAMVMLDRKIRSLPVMEGSKLVGIISDRDIFHALVDITGVRHDGHRVFLTLGDQPGSVREAADIIRNNGFHLQGILTSYEGAREGYRSVVIRATGKGNFDTLKTELEKAYPRCVQIRKG
jgi:acetoin utilization protein AcuB